MKINKIYIGAFGKFKDYTIDFGDGLNVIYGENENGKSTLMAFIKMMFYGSGRASSQISKSPRLKYTPWSGEKMAGRIFFEHNGTNYCLEREFMKSDATDKVRLINTDLGTSEVVGSSVGNDFFSISASAFERTVFIGATGGFSKDDEANGEINSKLSNLASTGDEDVSFQTVLNRINDTRFKLMSKSGKAGKYDKGIIELQRLGQELSLARENESRKSELNRRIEQIREESEQLSREYIEVKRIVDSEYDIRNRKKLEEYLSLKAELDDSTSKLRLINGSVCDESFVKKVEFCISRTKNSLDKIGETEREISSIEESIRLAESTDSSELQNRQTELEAYLKKDKEALINTENSIKELEAELNRLNSAHGECLKKKKAFSPPLLFTAIPLILAAALFIIIDGVLLAALLGILGLTAAALSFIIRPLDKKAVQLIENEISDKEQTLLRLKNDESAITHRIVENTEALNRILTVMGGDKAVIEHKKLTLNELLSKLELARASSLQDTSELLELFSQYKTISTVDEAIELLPSLKEKADSLKQLKLKLKYISDDLGGISYSAAEEKLSKLSDGSLPTTDNFQQKKDELEALTEKITALKTEYSSITAELKTAFKDTVNPLDIENKISTLNQSLENQKYFCSISDIASQVLEKSFAEVRRSYGSVLEKKALSIFSELTNGAYSTVGISKSLDITVEKSGDFGSREIDYLSSGTIDQAYLSLRLAICELISDGKNLPLMLDDALCQYDDRRALTAIKFLKAYSAPSQSILFTCHKWLCDLAENEGIKINIL